MYFDTSGKEILKSLTNTEVSLPYQMQGRYWQKFCLMIFTARKLQEKCKEQNIDLYMTFLDLTKAFDIVSLDGLWKIIAKFGCPTRFIAMVWQFHDGT